MKNQYTFDEWAMMELFKSIIKEGFDNDPMQEKDFWYKVFGERDIKFYESYQIDKPQFPCIVISFISVPTTRNIHSSEIEQFSTVTALIDTFNQGVGDYGKEQLGIMINTQLKRILQSSFGLIINNNRTISNIDDSVYRRRIEAGFVYDNKNQIFYQGE